LNEAHYSEPDWEETFFGENYGRFLEIKNAYDPTHVLIAGNLLGGEESRSKYDLILLLIIC
jgi:FAD/FMN-containing dehydrogenase